MINELREEGIPVVSVIGAVVIFDDRKIGPLAVAEAIFRLCNSGKVSGSPFSYEVLGCRSDAALALALYGAEQ